MTTIKKLLNEIRAVNPDEIRKRLAEIEAEAKELRKVLRLANRAQTKQPADQCK